MSKGRKPKRTTASYLKDAARLAPIVPKLKKFRRRKTLKPYEKAQIVRYANAIPYSANLFPVKARIAKAKPDLLWPIYYTVKEKHKGKKNVHAGEERRMHGIFAMREDNFGNPGAFHIYANSGKYMEGSREFSLVSNGRKWIYWSLPKSGLKKRKLPNKQIAEYGRRAFELEDFPIEKLQKLAELQFRKLKTFRVALWTRHGRTRAVFDDLKQFLKWVAEEWEHYKETDEWVKGLAVWVR
ncbi:MAG: hypothetical protein KGJ13_04980 [Patescibacteria group bacterium]|nr:hypothetical protein [Patescibacteria group bacterium]